MAGLSQLTNGISFKPQTEHSSGLSFDQTKDEILQLSGFSNRLERILLALLQEHSALKERVEKDISDEVAKLIKGLDNEKSDREKGLAYLKDEIADQNSRTDRLTEKCCTSYGQNKANENDMWCSD